MSKLSLGLLGVGGKLVIEEGYLGYSHPYGKRFRVPLKSITTVSVDTVGGGKANLKIIGQGATLAEVVMPTPWAEKAQQWVLEEIK